jgi:hypothetical protein
MAPDQRDSLGRFLPQHGGYGTRIRKKYGDRRTREGKQLHDMIEGIIADLGGPTKLNAGQYLRLGGLRTRLIVLLQIGKWTDQQLSIIKEGELCSPLGKNFLSYAESIDRCIERLYKNGRRRERVPTIAELCAEAEGTKE